MGRARLRHRPLSEGLTNAFDEKGLYEHDFSVPADWAGRRIFLVFEGVMTDTDAKLNGQSVGPTHQGGFYRFKYEVTPLVKFGETEYARGHRGQAFGQQVHQRRRAQRRLLGLWRNFPPGLLEAVPPQFIERVAIDAKADGSFTAEVYLNGVTNAGEVEAQIQTLDGQNVGEPFRSALADTNQSGQFPSARLQALIPAPKLWTAETPNLYRAEFRLRQNDQIVHQIRQQFGFRTLEVRDGDGLYVNGRKIILRGVNRHSFWPDSGRCLERGRPAPRYQRPEGRQYQRRAHVPLPARRAVPGPVR